MRKDRGGAVGLAANTSTDLTELCCVRVLTDYIRHAYLTVNDPLFITSNRDHLKSMVVQNLVF
jgi:hypothetical protein